jgi:hypothetical protein
VVNIHIPRTKRIFSMKVSLAMPSLDSPIPPPSFREMLPAALIMAIRLPPPVKPKDHSLTLLYFLKRPEIDLLIEN